MSYLDVLRIVGFCCVAIVGVAGICLLSVLWAIITQDPAEVFLSETAIKVSKAGVLGGLIGVGVLLFNAARSLDAIEETARQVFWGSVGSVGLTGFLCGVVIALFFVLAARCLGRCREDD